MLSLVVAVVSQTWLGTAVSDETEGDNSKHDSSPFNDIDPSSDLYKKLKEQSEKFIPGRSFDEASFDDEHFANYDPYVDGRYPAEADRFFDPDRYPAKGHYGAKYDDSYEPYAPYDYNYDSRGPYPGGLSSNPYHSSSPCSNLPGGLTRMATGVDITKLELFNIESNQPGGFKGPIIDFSCEEGKMWTNSYNSRTYQVPDEIWKIDNVPGESINRVATVFRSYEEIKQYLLELTGLEEKNGMFSLSKSFSELTKEVELDSKMIVDVTSHLFNTEIMMEPHQTIPLGFHVESFLATLADDYEDEPEGYEEFIETFGTHYYSSATVGPFIRNQFSVSEKYYLEHNEANIKQESLNWFTNWYDSHANKKTAKLNIDKNFEASTVSRAEIYGGQSEIFEDKGVDGWLETAVDVPTIFKGKLTPISNLIDDPRIKASMERAVQIHLDRAFLTELKEGLEITEKKYQKGKIQNLVKIHEEVQKMAKSKVLDHDLLTMWGKTVKSSLAVPKWWQQTYLCYKYSNDVQNKYCSGPTPTCAPVNQFTELYQASPLLLNQLLLKCLLATPNASSSL